MVSAREFYAYRLQMRESINSILLVSGRLLQQFVVDMYVKIETSRLDYFRTRQDEIRSDLYQGIVDSIGQGENNSTKVGKKIILPGTFIGGPRDMRKKYLDAMTLVERYGKPDLFLTMTCNPKWCEITKELKKHEESQNRPDLLTRVFKSKFEELKKHIFKKKIFGPIAAYTYVIEFQKRGLPHAHILLILKKPHKLDTADDFDKFISAEIPDKKKYPHLYAVVLRHMIHGPCGLLNKSNSCMRNGSCKDHYPRNYCNETVIAEDGYPIYKRRFTNEQIKIRGHMLNNTWVVPYNPYLLAMFDCHINVEVCSTIKAVKYLYKYMYKGHDKIIYKIATSLENECIDEISQYQSARWVSPPEAIWRIYRFPMYNTSPSVISLQLHLEGRHVVSFKTNKNLDNVADSLFYSKTMLTQYFWMNNHNKKAKENKYLYKDFPQHFVWKKQPRTWCERKSKDVVGRIVTANPIEGERYYLRLLLSHIPGSKSYEHLRTIDGYQHQTNKQAAVAFGLLEDDKSHEICMQEGSAYQMPNSLRQLFCTILVHCNPANPKELYIKFESELTQDYINLLGLTHPQARQKILHTLNSELESMGKSIRHYNLSDFLTQPTEPDHTCREIRDELAAIVPTEDINNIRMLNTEQRMAYDGIVTAVLKNEHKSFFIDGPGGTGKTYLYKSILATIRSKNLIALATASSGVAASILPNGRTAHSRFKIPINGEGKLTCNISKQSGLASLIKQSSLIIWDEASMAKKQTIEALDTMLQDITEVSMLFGGKVVVLGGDFRQVLPVIPRGTKEDCMNASLIRSYIWSSLTKFRLEINMRAKTDPLFSAYILRIGNGTELLNSTEQIKIPDSLILEPSLANTPLDQLMEFVYPNFINDHPSPLTITESAILTPKNLTVDTINDKMISKFPGEEKNYLSIDETNDITQQGMYIDYLNSASPPGLPPHRLVLKKNCPIVMLRNINPSKGLCNGTRLICTKFHTNLIVAQIATGERQGEQVFIPRIPLQPNNPQLYPIEFTRRQFPVKLCYAMTINKAQGQTLKRVGIYLQEPVFSHGQLYVALSRATTSDNVRVHLETSRHQPSSYNHTKNIVYTELLAEANHNSTVIKHHDANKTIRYYCLCMVKHIHVNFIEIIVFD